MSTTRHFVITPNDGIREFSADQASRIAAGAHQLPEFAGCALRYMQLTVDEASDNGEVRIQTAGASIRFDAEGRLKDALPPNDAERISTFEHDAVVQWALRDMPAVAVTFH